MTKAKEMAAGVRYTWIDAGGCRQHGYFVRDGARGSVWMSDHQDGSGDLYRTSPEACEACEELAEGERR